jgi:F-type H+-transporting ATPase subunit epsilon
MAGELTLRVITPDRIAVDATAESIRFPAADGLMGVLPRHAPMVAALDAGVLMYRSGGREHTLFVSGGFAEVRDDTVRLVTQAGEAAADIDVERAREAERRARERLDEARAGERKDVDVLRAEAALRRAVLRLRVRAHA